MYKYRMKSKDFCKYCRKIFLKLKAKKKKQIKSNKLIKMYIFKK